MEERNYIPSKALCNPCCATVVVRLQCASLDEKEGAEIATRRPCCFAILLVTSRGTVSDRTSQTLKQERPRALIVIVRGCIQTHAPMLLFWNT